MLIGKGRFGIIALVCWRPRAGVVWSRAHVERGSARQRDAIDLIHDAGRPYNVAAKQHFTTRGADGGCDGPGARFDAASEAPACCRQFPVVG